jgi:hypothetical protein
MHLTPEVSSMARIINCCDSYFGQISTGKSSGSELKIQPEQFVLLSEWTRGFQGATAGIPGILELSTTH